MKKKDIMYEEELKKSLDKIPSLKKRILKILEQYPKGIKAYSEIENLLTQDIDTNQNTERKELESSSEAFFRQLANTGLKIKDENKININGEINSINVPAQEISGDIYIPIKELEDIKFVNNTLIFYEAPHRIDETLEDMISVLGNREACLARELTKSFESMLEGN